MEREVPDIMGEVDVDSLVKNEMPEVASARLTRSCRGRWRSSGSGRSDAETSPRPIPAFPPAPFSSRTSGPRAR